MNGSRVILKDATITARLRKAARVAVAIERFRASHDNDPPKTLADLTPFGNSGLPIDPFNGQSAALQEALSHRYAIYSVGEKGDGDVKIARKTWRFSWNIEPVVPSLRIPRWKIVDVFA